MEKIKFLFWQAAMISFGILIGVSIEGLIWHFTGRSFMLTWYQVPSIVLAGVLCSLPSLLLTIAKDWPRKKYIMMVVLHCVLLYIMIMALGFLFKWCDTVAGVIAVTIEFFAVYIFVWAATAWMGFLDQKNINKALDDIRDDE